MMVLSLFHALRRFEKSLDACEKAAAAFRKAISFTGDELRRARFYINPQSQYELTTERIYNSLVSISLSMYQHYITEEEEQRFKERVHELLKEYQPL